MPDLDALQRRLGHRFGDLGLLQRALTHRSASLEHNERLEFLGDAVLSTAVSTLLFRRFSDAPEGDLTRARAHLVREASLHRTALDIGLPDLVRLSEGEARGGGAARPSILADAVEALIGAVFMDGGYDAAHAVTEKLFGDIIDTTDPLAWTKDSKTELQEWLQARRLSTPSYRVIATRGQAHDQTFEVACMVDALDAQSRGEGRSRRAAEQAAAGALLERLRQRDAAAGDKGGA